MYNSVLWDPKLSLCVYTPSSLGAKIIDYLSPVTCISNWQPSLGLPGHVKLRDFSDLSSKKTTLPRKLYQVIPNSWWPGDTLLSCTAKGFSCSVENLIISLPFQWSLLAIILCVLLLWACCLFRGELRCKQAFLCRDPTGWGFGIIGILNYLISHSAARNSLVVQALGIVFLPEMWLERREKAKRNNTFTKAPCRSLQFLFFLPSILQISLLIKALQSAPSSAWLLVCNCVRNALLQCWDCDVFRLENGKERTLGGCLCLLKFASS